MLEERQSGFGVERMIIKKFSLGLLRFYYLLAHCKRLINVNDFIANFCDEGYGRC